MLASNQHFELRWGSRETTDGSVVCLVPALYSHVGPDGVPLSEPKLWSPAIESDMEVRDSKFEVEWGEQEEEQEGEQGSHKSPYRVSDLERERMEQSGELNHLLPFPERTMSGELS